MLWEKLSPIRSFVWRWTLIRSEWCRSQSSTTAPKTHPPDPHVPGKAFSLSAAGTRENDGISVLRLCYSKWKMGLGDRIKIPNQLILTKSKGRFFWVNLT